jgi:hypothetical protein
MPISRFRWRPSTQLCTLQRNIHRANLAVVSPNLLPWKVMKCKLMLREQGNIEVSLRKIGSKMLCHLCLGQFTIYGYLDLDADRAHWFPKCGLKIAQHSFYATAPRSGHYLFAILPRCSRPSQPTKASSLQYVIRPHNGSYVSWLGSYY